MPLYLKKTTMHAFLSMMGGLCYMKIRIAKYDSQVKKIGTCGVGCNSAIDKIVALLLVLAPIFQHYIGIFENAGFSVLLLVFPILLIRLITKLKAGMVNKNCVAAIMPLMIYELYYGIVKSLPIMKRFYAIFMIMMFLVIACGCINTRLFIKYAAEIACIASILLIVQYISYYLLGRAINFEFTQLLADQNSRWAIANNAATGVPILGKLYRPSGFFLEPSHFYLYCFPVLTLCLLYPEVTKWRMQHAIMISIGMVLSTSGMGIAATAGLWGLYLVFYKYNKKISIRSILSGRTVIIAIGLIIALVVAYIAIPVVKSSVDRIFFNTSGSTAIDGRIRLARNYISKMQGKEIVLGVDYSVGDLEFNMSGFFATYIKTGLIGLLLTYGFYVQGMFKFNREYFWLTFIIIVTSLFSAHTHGTFYMLYYVIFLVNGYYENGTPLGVSQPKK